MNYGFDWSKIRVVIQARMGSIRLPGKTLRKVGNSYLIDHVLQRILVIVPAASVTVATTNLSEDDQLVDYLEHLYDIGIYRGSSNDVQRRFIEVGNMVKAEYLVRITADDPFKDPSHIPKLLDLLISSNLDYVDNFSNKLYPVGLDIEAFSLESLIDSRNLFDSDLNREHVTVALRNESRYRRASMVGSTPVFEEVRLTIDTFEDLIFCSKVAHELEKKENSYSVISLSNVLHKLLKGA